MVTRATAAQVAQYGYGKYVPPTVISSKKSAYHGPDPVLVKDQLLALQGLYRKYGKAMFSEQMFWIIRKNPEPGEQDLLSKMPGAWNQRLVPFKHNAIQLDLDDNMGLRNILLKMRQGGYTTYCILMRLLLPRILEPGTGGLLISQSYKYVSPHFGILLNAYRRFAMVNPYDKSANTLTEQLHANLLHTSYSNRRELIFDQTDSRIVCESAENEEAGQGITVHAIVCSEVSRWPGNPEETLANAKEGMAKDGTLDLEATANGIGNYYHQECLRSRDPANKDIAEFKYFFHQWWWEPGYRIQPPVKEDTVTEEEKTLIENFKLDLSQIAWRRKKIIALRHNFAEKYPEDDVTAFLLSGSTFFDKDICAQRYKELTVAKPYDTFKRLTIWVPRIKNRRYVIGADVATGITRNSTDPDYSAACVLDLETGEQVASYRYRLPEEQYAWDLAELGRLYNNAIIAVERTGYGGTTIVTLEVACGYTNLYKHKDWWRRTKTVQEWLGFPTTTKTRPLLLNRLRYIIHDSPELLHDPMLMSECLTFIYSPTGRPEAAPGAHDDTVLSAGIAAYCRAVLLGTLDPLTIPGERYGHTPSEYAEDEEYEGPPQ